MIIIIIIIIITVITMTYVEVHPHSGSSPSKSKLSKNTTRGYPVALLVPFLASFEIESMKNVKETCCYRNIYRLL